jgi:leucyl-tRNA synthetase
VLKQGRQPLTTEKVQPNAVEKQGEGFVLKADPAIKIDSRAYKMSKSRGNVVNPDEVVREYGADALRLYEMFMGPLEAVKPWSMDGVSGVRGFLDRAWRMMIDDKMERMQLNAAVQAVEPTAEQNRMLHKTIKAVTGDLDQMSFNTAISRMMEFTNFFLKSDVRPKSAMERFVLLLSPFAPHVAEELWQALRGLSQFSSDKNGTVPLRRESTLAYELWPTFDEAALREDTIEVPVQVNGKLRWRIQVPTDLDKASLEAAARADAKVAELLAGKTVVKTIVVPGRMVNFVVKA